MRSPASFNRAFSRKAIETSGHPNSNISTAAAFNRAFSRKAIETHLITSPFLFC